MLSKRPQHVEMATSYFESIPPKSPLKNCKIFFFFFITCELREDKMIKICQNKFTNLPNIPGIFPDIFCDINASKTLLFERITCIESIFSCV